MDVMTPLSDALNRYLDLTSEQMKLTASNMANIDTPGYKTEGFDFEQQFMQEMSGSAQTDFGAGATVEDVDGLVSRPDGNNVSMDREGMQMAKSQLQFRLGVELLKQQFTNVMDAIHAEAK
jgi:flagellar basal-body rod protein FlgB